MGIERCHRRGNSKKPKAAHPRISVEDLKGIILFQLLARVYDVVGGINKHQSSIQSIGFIYQLESKSCDLYVGTRE